VFERTYKHSAVKNYNFATTPLPESARFALIQQAIVLVLSAGMLDGGELAQICFYAFVAFWGGTGVLVARRGATITRADILLIRWSYIPLCIGSFFLTHWIWNLRGF
jgi:hypothetical protein